MNTVGSLGVYMQRIKAQVIGRSEAFVNFVDSSLVGDMLEIPCHNLKTGKEEKARFEIVDIDRDTASMNVKRMR